MERAVCPLLFGLDRPLNEFLSLMRDNKTRTPRKRKEKKNKQRIVLLTELLTEQTLGISRTKV